MKRFGLVGHPLGHSFSKAYFNEKFKRAGLDCEYQNYDIEDITKIKQLVREQPDLSGFNVTIPYKESIIPFLDSLDNEAQDIQAVNTVKVLPNGKLKGFNTDIIGIEKSLVNPSGSALILGTGGASKAVQYVLRKKNILYHLVSRDPLKGDFTYPELTTEIVQSHLLIINATPVGMAPTIDAAPILPYDALTPQHTLFDLIYNPEETLFLKRGKEKKATTINGLTMLYAQAEASWAIFF